MGAPRRLEEVPAVPTAAEAGAPWLAVDAWFGLWAPAGAPAAMLARLSQALQQVLAEPALVAQLRRIGFNAAPMPAAAFGAFQRAEVARWRELVDLTGIRIEG